ncbi:hypothetical protein L5515_017605 [Caenorhabditis briggsae]|uniref:Uncharacterized protein n=1 Tax=Caenorhabditis briggsae TaxID=6238 RepID=A0AAE9FE69_CAEBR|nr:hypothetical protein L5515_017605 [Caenorhabditis briggsae]
MGPNMEIEKSKGVMQEILYEVIEKSESYKFIRMADDLHDVASYLNDMRICFIALTVTGYIVLVIYLFVFCFRRSRRNQPRRRYGDYQLENQREFNNTQTTNEDMLTNVRSDVNSSYMGRNHHRGRIRQEKVTSEYGANVHAPRAHEPSADDATRGGQRRIGGETPNTTHYNGGTN